MLKLDLCESVLNKNEEGYKYTSKEVSEIREFLYQLAQLEYSNLKSLTDDKERGIICQSIN
jgi:hypothetical protein